MTQTLHRLQMIGEMILLLRDELKKKKKVTGIKKMPSYRRFCIAECLQEIIHSWKALHAFKTKSSVPISCLYCILPQAWD